MLSQEKKEEIQETLKVAKDIVEALKLDNEETVELERKRKQCVVSVRRGALHNSCKILEIGQGIDNTYKRCYITISANESLTSHMRCHTKPEETKIMCDPSEVKTPDVDIK